MIMSADDIGQLQRPLEPGLVAPITAPSWALAFGTIGPR